MATQEEAVTTEKVVPLVMYHDDRRIVIGTATVNVEALLVKGHIAQDAERLIEIVGTVFQFG